MKALVVHGPDDLRIDELPEPEAGPGEVVIDIEWGGICGSDLSYWRNGASGTAVLKHPLVLGHEIAGRVARLGPGVTGVTVGQPVTVHPAELVGDGVMPGRLAGRTNLYPAVRYFGSAAFTPHTDGGFCQRKAVRATQLRTLPDGVSTLHGALAEPLAVAMHAVKRAGDLSGKDILVNGAGPIGCMVIAAAKNAGARNVIATDLSDASLSIAAAMGADVVQNVTDPSHMPTDVELVFEASGAPAALGHVLRATVRGGVLVQVGNLPGAPAPAVLGDLVTREITWIGSYRFVEEITDALDAMAGGLDLSPVITHRIDLSDAHEAMALAADRLSGSSKVMLNLGSPTLGTPLNVSAQDNQLHASISSERLLP